MSLILSRANVGKELATPEVVAKWRRMVGTEPFVSSQLQAPTEVPRYSLSHLQGRWGTGSRRSVEIVYAICCVRTLGLVWLR